VGEAVAIISVSASAVVGIGGLVAAAWGGSRQRRWQSREERTIDLRAAVEGASESFGDAMTLATEAYAGVQRTGKLDDERKPEMAGAWSRVVASGNRVGVRRGTKSAAHRAYADCMAKLFAVMAIVDEAAKARSVEGLEGRWIAAHEAAVAAESAFLDASARLLNADA